MPATLVHYGTNNGPACGQRFHHEGLTNIYETDPVTCTRCKRTRLYLYDRQGIQASGGYAPPPMPSWWRPGTSAVRTALTAAWKAQAGKPVSDLDRAYRRGWRDAVRRLRADLRNL